VINKLTYTNYSQPHRLCLISLVNSQFQLSGDRIMQIIYKPVFKINLFEMIFTLFTHYTYTLH